jgi:hypothetical protein
LFCLFDVLIGELSGFPVSQAVLRKANFLTENIVAVKKRRYVHFQRLNDTTSNLKGAGHNISFPAFKLLILLKNNMRLVRDLLLRHAENYSSFP